MIRQYFERLLNIAVGHTKVRCKAPKADEDGELGGYFDNGNIRGADYGAHNDFSGGGDNLASAGDAEDSWGGGGGAVDNRATPAVGADSWNGGAVGPW